MDGRAKRPLVNGPFIAGLLIVVLGVGQLVFFMLLDELGIVEVGNALGHGLLMVFTVPIGLILLGIGVGIAAARSRPTGAE